MDKSSKLQTVFDRIELVSARMDNIAKDLEIAALRRKLALLESPHGEARNRPVDASSAARLLEVDMALQRATTSVRQDKEFLQGCNRPGEFMDAEKIERLERIAAKTYDHDGQSLPYLSPEELGFLSIRKGTLSVEERKIIESHARLTYDLLQELPFPKRMARVADYASQHHEKLDGSGYPFGLRGDELSLQARIMVVADIFEALTAKDRPYKKPMPLSQAIKIMEFMKKDGHIDADVCDVLMTDEVLRPYVEDELDIAQVDIPIGKGRPAALPLDPKAALARMMDEACAAPSLEVADTRPRLLLVDDSVNTRMLFRHYLRNTPYALDCADRASQGLERFAAGDYALAFFELELPDCDGFAAVQAIREWERRGSRNPRPVVALTVHTFADVEKRCKASGFTCRVSKPLTRDELLDLVESFVKRLG